MNAKEIFEILKQFRPESCEKPEWNKVTYAGAQKVEKEFKKWIKKNLKSADPTAGMKRLEPMDAEERKKEILLMIDEQIDQRNSAGIERLMTAIDKVYGLSGDARLVVEMVDFKAAFPDLAYAKEVFETAMSTREDEDGC